MLLLSLLTIVTILFGRALSQSSILPARRYLYLFKRGPNPPISYFNFRRSGPRHLRRTCLTPRSLLVPAPTIKG